VLRISGYSGRGEWGKWWWNYDLPPGWQEYTDKSLEEVCAFQWYSANAAVRKYLQKSQDKYCLIRYENMIGSFILRKREINKIINFMKLDPAVIESVELHKLPVVQATAAPRAYRWVKRKNMLRPLLDDPGLAQMSAQLGYCKNNLKEWL
jgi:hypothetical protein